MCVSARRYRFFKKKWTTTIHRCVFIVIYRLYAVSNRSTIIINIITDYNGKINCKNQMQIWTRAWVSLQRTHLKSSATLSIHSANRNEKIERCRSRFRLLFLFSVFFSLHSKWEQQQMLTQKSGNGMRTHTHSHIAFNWILMLFFRSSFEFSISILCSYVCTTLTLRMSLHFKASELLLFCYT